MVAVSVLAKGRSTSRRITRVLRKISSLLLQHDLVLDVIWVASGANPSDAPSRGQTLAAWREGLDSRGPISAEFQLRAPPHTMEAWRRMLAPGKGVEELPDTTGGWHFHSGTATQRSPE
eukprot:4440064-Amphidinium_carterae.1